MKKLISLALMLSILTLLVSGSSAAPQRNNDHFTGSISEYSNAYATSSSEDGDAFVTSTSFAAAGVGKKGAFATGATQTYADGGTGTCADSGQTISGTLYP